MPNGGANKESFFGKISRIEGRSNRTFLRGDNVDFLILPRLSSLEV